MRGLPTVFVARREPTYAYAQSPHYTGNIDENTPYSEILPDPPRDTEFVDALSVTGDRAHRAAKLNINLWWNPSQWNPLNGVMGMDDFIPQPYGHPTIPLKSASPFGYQLPWPERFNNSGLADDTTSYNTVVDKLVAAVKLRRRG